MHAQPDTWNALEPIHRTVVVVDLVGYSSLARMLEENMGAGAVAELNRRIQDLIQEALEPLPSCSYTLIAKTGDGALVLFKDAVCAHQFAVELHRCASLHNTARSDKSAHRAFRIGIASGEITVLEQEYAGVTIANAVRLEAAAKPGEIVVDLATFGNLPPEARALYSSESTVRGKRDEVFRVRRRAAASAPAVHPITRRKAIAISVGAATGVGLGWWGLASPRLGNLLHPLPGRRFVAFAAWPEPAAEIAAVTHEVVSSLKQSLQRMETFDHGFLVVDAEEPGDTAPTLKKPTPLESAQKFGANLALLAASETVDSRLHLALQVVDTKTQTMLRHATLSAPLKDLAGLRERAMRRAAAMLDLPEHLEPIEDDEEIGRMPPQAYKLFAEGKALGADFNGPHRLEGIEKLQELVNAHPKLAVGYGELAAAYMEQFRNSRDPSTLGLAEANAKRALSINPDSTAGLLSSAEVQTARGRPDDALSLLQKLLGKDPQNPDALRYRAEVYREKGDSAGELRAYRQIIDVRPNYWKAYVNRGRLLWDQSAYAKALEDFQMAAHVAPGVSLPLTNLGTVYLATEKPHLAQEAFEQSVKLFPTSEAYEGLGTIAFGRKDYLQALDAYQSALKLTPRSHDLYRDIGDCQTMLGRKAAATASFTKAADLLAGELKVNPLSGSDWMLLSLYHAKIGASNEALEDIARAQKHDADGVEAQFTRAQTLAVLGRRDESLKIIVSCLQRGLSKANVDLAVDLREIVQDKRYVAATENKPS